MYTYVLGRNKNHVLLVDNLIVQVKERKAELCWISWIPTKRWSTFSYYQQYIEYIGYIQLLKNDSHVVGFTTWPAKLYDEIQSSFSAVAEKDYIFHLSVKGQFLSNKGQSTVY